MIFAVVLVAFAGLASAQPVDQLPVLRQVPSEVLFRVGTPSKPAVLECIIEGSSKPLKHSWEKDGKPLDLKSNPDIVQRNNEGSIVFLNPKDQDQGIYRCIAESEDGIARTRPVSFKKTFIHAPKVSTAKHTPVEGKPFKLDCSIPESYPKPSITWIMQSIGDPTVTNPIFSRRILASPEGSLYFTSLEKEDTQKNFKYVCLARTPASDRDVVLAEHLIEDVTVNKDNTPVLEPLYVSKDMTVKAGEVTMIYCIFGGVPLAYPDWFKGTTNVNGQPGDRVTSRSRSSGKRLLIRDTWVEDQGSYTCKANNDVAKPQEHTMKLTVVSAPKYEKVPEAKMIGKQGQDVTIPCEISSGNPEWTYNAKPLTGNKYTIGKTGVTIKNVQKADNGYYGCGAKNEHGDIYAETLLRVA